MTWGIFKIKKSDNKAVIKLKGDFDSNNIHGIKKVLVANYFLHNGFWELDMNEVNTINMKAMAMIVLTLKKLKESGILTTVTGLNKANLKLAEGLGMQFITQIK